MTIQLRSLFLSAALAAMILPAAAQDNSSTSTTPTQPAKATPESVGAQRQANQQGRIAQGVQSGQLTSGEEARLENQQSKLNEEVKDMKAANGGKLTAADK